MAERTPVSRRSFPENPTPGLAGHGETGPMAGSVIVVDDDAGFRDLARRILLDCGYRPIGEARSVSDALQQVTRLTPDLALVDIGLPDGDGLELTRRLTAPPWHVRVVLVSADTEATSQGEALDAGAVGFVPKSELACGVLDVLLTPG